MEAYILIVTFIVGVLMAPFIYLLIAAAVLTFKFGWPRAARTTIEWKIKLPET